MGRPLPLCAHCGETLKGAARVVIGFQALPGHPMVGWHVETKRCLDADPLAVVGQMDEPAVKLSMVREIDARGPERVRAGKRWACTAN